MNWTQAATVALMLSACAAPQPIECRVNPASLLERKECVSGAGDAGHLRGERQRDNGASADRVDSNAQTAASGRDSATDDSVGGTGVADDGAVPGNDAVTPTSTPPSSEPSDDTPDAGKRHQNASANNGKGGNYDRTGHADNGKGKGRYR